MGLDMGTGQADPHPYPHQHPHRHPHGLYLVTKIYGCGYVTRMGLANPCQSLQLTNQFPGLHSGTGVCHGLDPILSLLDKIAEIGWFVVSHDKSLCTLHPLMTATLTA